jgi:hypothetical protein
LNTFFMHLLAIGGFNLIKVHYVQVLNIAMKFTLYN